MQQGEAKKALEVLQKPGVLAELQVIVKFFNSVCCIIYLLFHLYINWNQDMELYMLQYKFAPELIMLDAYETVESWMITNNLNPRKLIPAMMRYSGEPHAK